MYSPATRKRSAKKHHALSPRDQEMAQLASTQEALKKANEELEKEKQLKQEIEDKYTELQVKHEAVSKSSEKHARILERVKNDNEKKTKQVELMQREQTYSEQRIKNLELRVSEVEKTEMQLETVRDVLKTTQTTVRDRDNEIKSLKQTLDETNKQLNNAKENIQELNTKVGDLNQQVRDEVKRNQAMEKELEVVPILQKELEETKEALETSKKHLQERRAQLSLARQSIKDQRNKIQSLEAEVCTIPQIEDELRMAHYEILTLKKLIIGKDSLVVQKTQELECIREHLQGDNQWSKLYQATYPSGAHLKVTNLESRHHIDIDSMLEFRFIPGRQMHRVSQTQLSSKQVDVGQHPYSMSTDQRQRMESVGGKSDGDKHPVEHSTPTSPKRRRAKTAVVRPYVRTYSKDLESSTSNEKTQQRPHTSLGFHSQPSSPSPTRRGGPKLNRFHIPPGSLVLEEDWMRAQYIRFGDRVMVRFEEKHGRKQKDKDNEKPPLTGIVRFVGKIDRGYQDPRIYVGVHMDEPIGDTDGVFMGKRYFTVMPRHGKLVKISEIVSVLNPKSTSYKLMKECLREERIESGKTKATHFEAKTVVRVP
ncbi:uncharacterized protein LOC144437381 [Glandiceps talaboti]